jgi:hypothetical protein
LLDQKKNFWEIKKMGEKMESKKMGEKNVKGRKKGRNF